MTASPALRPRRQHHTNERPVGVLKTAIGALRTVQDEQMRMWEAFYRVEPASRRALGPQAGKVRHPLPKGGNRRNRPSAGP